jgi:hypothetical protein
MTLFGFEGNARLWTIFEYVDAEYAKKLLPKYLHLASSPDFPPGKHPMMYSFGKQTVAMRPFTWFKTTYRESIIGVCSVQLEDGSSDRRYSLMTATQVSSVLALLLGRLLGFPKTLKRISATENAYDVMTWLKKDVMFSNTFRPASQPFAPATVGWFRPIEMFLDAPAISQSPFGPRLASHFQIDMNNWTVTPVSATGAIRAQDVAGLPGGAYTWPAVGAEPLGAFLTEHRWSAKWPSMT